MREKLPRLSLQNNAPTSIRGCRKSYISATPRLLRQDYASLLPLYAQALHQKRQALAAGLSIQNVSVSPATRSPESLKVLRFIKGCFSALHYYIQFRAINNKRLGKIPSRFNLPKLLKKHKEKRCKSFRKCYNIQ